MTSLIYSLISSLYFHSSLGFLTDFTLFLSLNQTEKLTEISLDCFSIYFYFESNQMILYLPFLLSIISYSLLSQPLNMKYATYKISIIFEFLSYLFNFATLYIFTQLCRLIFKFYKTERM